MPSEKRKKPKTEHYKANYQGATPVQVAQAIMKYRPVQADDAPTGKGEPNPTRLIRHQRVP